MSPDNVRERKEKRRYTFVVVPHAKTQQTRTFSITQWGLIGSVLALFIVVVALVVAAIIYTPIGSHLPLSSPEIAKQYGKQIVEIQKQLQGLLQEINILRGYNLRLRRAMGEKISPSDSALASAVEATLRAARPMSAPASDQPQDAGAGERLMAAAADQMTAGEPGGMSRIWEAMAVAFPLSLPANGYLTRGFDPEQFHFGIDFAGKVGSPVLAAADGNVVFAGWTYDYGYVIMVVHPEGYMTVYKHNQSLLKNAGESVRRGEMIALLGNTGRTSSGPHLHFEVWKDGVALDPSHYILSTQ